MEGIGGVVVQYDLAIRTENELLPILVKQLIRLIYVEHVALSASYLLRLVKGDKLNHVAIEVILMAAHVVMLLSVQIMLPQDLEEVPHHGGTQGREGLTADGDHLPRIGSAIMKNHPEQDVVRFPAPSSPLLNCDALLAFEQVFENLIRLDPCQ
jgi:hypothetical protein